MWLENAQNEVNGPSVGAGVPMLLCTCYLFQNFCPKNRSIKLMGYSKLETFPLYKGDGGGGVGF